MTLKTKISAKPCSAAACQVKAREYAESWLNGNREHVNAEIGNSVLKLSATFLALQEYAPADAQEFMRYMFNSRVNWRRI